MALITLTEAVPVGLVRNIPKVNTGWVSHLIDDTSDYATAGFGRHSEGVPSDGLRRYGSHTGVGLHILTCGPSWRSKIGGTCLRYPEIWASSRGGAVGLDGDSGGPLFAWDNTLREYVLIGVRSGHRWWKSDPVGSIFYAKQVFAPIGFTAGSGGVQIASRIGPDADGDGVPDHLDNCPPSFCEEHNLPAWRCVNPNQEDDDRDGIGEMCDNCPKRICDAIGDGRSCANVDQNDFDSDGVGDVCDICPEIASPEDKNPPRGKVIGDACGCPGNNSLTYVSCSPGSLTCHDRAAGTCLYDHDSNGRLVGGLCSRLSDHDADGTPDACDDCEFIRDRSNRNSNLAIEKERGVAINGDACDPVPLFPFDAGDVPVYKPPFFAIFGSGHLGVDIEEIQGYPWMGYDSVVKIPVSLRETVEFRHCSCFGRGGEQLTTDACVKLDECLPSLADAKGGDWKDASIFQNVEGRKVPGLGGPMSFSNYVPSSDPNDPGPQPIAATYYWDIYQDATRQADPIERDGNRTHGLLASVVMRSNEQYGSGRDRDVALRTSLKMFSTPRVGTMLPDFVVGPCFFPQCMGVLLRPWEPIWRPWEERSLFDRAQPLIFSEYGPVTLRRDGSYESVADRVSPLVTELMVSRDWLWLPPSETSAYLSENGVRNVGVLIPREGTLGKRPLALKDVEGIIGVLGSPDFAPSLEDLSGALQLGPGDRAVFSARENRLYVAGHDTGWRLLDFQDRSLGSPVFDRTPTGDVLGMTLDTLSGRIFTLEVESGEGDGLAQIVAYDKGRGESSILWTAPYTGAYTKMALMADGTGALVLVASTYQTTRAWRYAVNGNDLRFIGQLSIEGTLLDEPHHASGMLPIFANKVSSLVDIGPADFTGKEPCGSL